jgi:hypothetical protein
MSTKARQPVKALNKDANTVAANAAADKARKAASKKALKATKPEVPAEQPKPEAPVVDHAAEYAANAVKAATADAEALGIPVEQVLADMGLNADGTPAKLVDSKAKYDGPMLALRTAALTYITAKNGQPCNGDPLAMLCGQYSRTEVVVGLIKAMGLPGNPYFHLNPGQQSMNLRNKARAQITKGLLTLAQIEAALK